MSTREMFHYLKEQSKYLLVVRVNTESETVINSLNAYSYTPRKITNYTRQSGTYFNGSNISLPVKRAVVEMFHQCSSSSEINLEGLLTSFSIYLISFLVEGVEIRRISTSSWRALILSDKRRQILQNSHVNNWWLFSFSIKVVGWSNEEHISYFICYLEGF